MIYGKAALRRFLGKGLEQLLRSRALFFGEVKPSQCISRSPGLMVRTVHHLAVKWDFGVSMWEKKKKKYRVHQEHLRKKVPAAAGTNALLTARLYSEIIAREKKENRKEAFHKSSRKKHKRLFGNKCLATCFEWYRIFISTFQQI